jgi:oxidase EvaA
MFLVQMKTEPGLYDMVELSPTVQCIAENYETGKQPRYLDEFHDKELIYQARQSEEGGRFYRECNLNMIREASGFKNTDPENYLWISLANMKEMVQTQRMLNVELRSLLAYF